MLKKKIISIVLSIIFVLIVVTGCDGGKDKDDVLVIYSSHPLEFIDSLLSNFENDTGIRVKTVVAGTGVLIKRLQSESSDPKCDVLWGGSYSTVLPFQKLFEDYKSKNEPYIQDQFKNTDGCMTRFSDIPSVLMVNRLLAGDMEINGYDDLLNPLLKGKIAVSNPMQSSSSREHLINIIYAMGKSDIGNAREYLSSLCDNLDGKLLKSSVEVYEGVASGRFAVGLTFEEGARKYEVRDEHIEVIYMSEGVVSTPDGVYIIKQAVHKDNAKTFVDYITSYDAQQYMVDKLNRRSVRKDVLSPPTMKKKEEINIISVDYNSMEEKLANWIIQFKDIFDATCKTYD